MGNKVINARRINLKEILLIIIVLSLFINLIKSWIKLGERLEIIKESKIKVIEEQKKQEDLERKLAQAASREFIEKQAREKLNMAKEGELIILLPSPVLSASPTPEPSDTSANWQKWMRLFW